MTLPTEPRRAPRTGGAPISIRPSVRRAALLAALLAAAAPSAAQTRDPAPPAATVGTGASGGGLRALRATRAEGVRVDGRLDDAAWAGADVATDFVQQRPRSGAPASDRTEVRVLYDADAIYVGARMFARPDSIAAQLARRDASGIFSDWFHVMIDSYHDRRTGFRFAVNPRGVQKDVFHSNDTNEDVDWDAVWESAVSVDSAGWVAEMRIPLSQLRFAKSDEAERTWGLNFLRDAARRDERSYWSPILANTQGFVSRAGELRGLAGLGTPRRLEILPYTSARLTHDRPAVGDPFRSPNEGAANVGADVKVGLPLGLTLTGTINPDFGQVEVDPAVVNLSAFETFFPEKRPFFVEGSDIFNFGQIQTYNNFGFVQDYFYSRRIGRSPQRSVDADFVDRPDASTILGAVKVSGKTPGGWSVGLMNALTQREEARFGVAERVDGSTPVEPLTNYFVGRLRRDMRGGRTVVGGIVTATHRDLKGDEFDDLLRSRAVVAGLDGEHFWKNREWSVSGSIATGRVYGSPTAIVRTQRASQRYFQRPDADWVAVDSARTSLGGWNSALSLRHGGPWDLSLTYQDVSPGFESNDIGFQGSADRRAFSTFIGRPVEVPNKLFRSHSYFAYSNTAWNYGGDVVNNGYSVGANGTFHNLWYGGVNVFYAPDYKNDRLTRGGPLAGVPSQYSYEINGGSDPRKRVAANGFVYTRRDDSGENERTVGLNINLRPSSSVQVSVGPRYSRQVDTDQFVDVFTDEAAAGTFGRRYVFADLRSSELSMNTRVDWTFTPKLSLQVFAQPYISAGDFDRFKEFTTPGEFAFAAYGRDRGVIERGDLGTGSGIGGCTGDRGASTYTVDPDGAGAGSCFQFSDPDFNFRSLRGNAVLRWEYRPGSALFLVWQQNRSGEEPFGDFETGRDVRGIFDQRSSNVFLIKATYWLSR